MSPVAACLYKDYSHLILVVFPSSSGTNRAHMTVTMDVLPLDVTDG